MTDPWMGQPVTLSLDVDVAPSFETEVDRALLTRVLTRALVAEGIEGEVEVSIVVSDDAELQTLNRQFRGIDHPTDVLSFSQLDESGETGPSPGAFPRAPTAARPLGDVVISGDRVREQAREYGHSQCRELAYLAVHGLLHLLGYDHETDAERQVMRAKEEAALVEVPREE